jgi:hypothetical protein
MRNIYYWRSDAMLDAGFWMLDTGLALKLHPKSSILYTTALFALQKLDAFVRVLA